jgi:hypothetical protein
MCRNSPKATITFKTNNSVSGCRLVWGTNERFSGGVAVMWKVVGAGGGNGVGLCSILVGEISCGYMLTAKNMRRGKMFVENVFEECLTFFQKVDKVSSLEY